MTTQPVKEFMIIIKDPAEVDGLFRWIYSEMLNQLRIGDIDAAMYAVGGGVHDKYLEIFNLLRPNLATVVDQLGTLQTGEFSGKTAEYTLVRDAANRQKAFYINFLRGEDGVWRIEGM